MSISVVANGGGIVVANATSTLSLTLGSGANRVAFVLAGCANTTTSTLTTATLGGGSLTVPAAMTINGRRVYPFLLNLSLTGSQTFQANWSEGSNHFIVYAVLQGSVGALSFGTPVQSSSTWTTNPLSIDISDSAAGDLIVALIQENIGLALTPGSGDSMLGTFTGGASQFRHGLRTDGASGTVNISGTFSGGTPNILAAAVAIKEAGGGDTTAPVLSSPTGTGGLGVCSGSVTTDEGNGTLYAVATASATQPTVAQIKAGQDHTGATALRAVSQAVSATGSQAIASGAITGGAGTRYWHFVHTDAAANDSNRVSSAGFSVTAAATSMTVALKLSDGTTAAASITSIHWAVLNAATLGAASAVLAAGTAESTDASGNLVLDVTGLGLATGDVRYVVAGKSNGTPGANFDGWHGPVAAA